MYSTVSVNSVAQHDLDKMGISTHTQELYSEGWGQREERRRKRGERND